MTCDSCKYMEDKMEEWDKTKKWRCRLGIHKIDKTKCYHEDEWKVCVYCGTATVSTDYF